MIRGEGKANKTRSMRKCSVRGSFEGFKERVERMAKGNCFLDTRKEMCCAGGDSSKHMMCVTLAVAAFSVRKDADIYST
jgi:hypothetical protein